jgi:hypothetical protein
MWGLHWKGLDHVEIEEGGFEWGGRWLEDGLFALVSSTAPHALRPKSLHRALYEVSVALFATCFPFPNLSFAFCFRETKQYVVRK